MNHRISEKFEKTSTYKIFTIFHEVILKEKFIQTSDRSPEAIATLLNENGVTEVLARKLDLSTLEVLNKFKINVFVGVKGDNPDSVIREYMEGKLITNDKITIE